MIVRLQDAFDNDKKISGADLDFYAHELFEMIKMKKYKMSYEQAHNSAKQYYNAKEFNLYHPDVIVEMPEQFNGAWYDFWGLDKN